jgi:MFS family permease
MVATHRVEVVVAVAPVRVIRNPRGETGARQQASPAGVAQSGGALRGSWAALVTLCAAQFVTVLDFQIVAIALPAVQDGLGFGERGVQWVVTAHALAFGGTLLLAGRAADLFGTRRLFVVGLATLAGGAVACGLAPSAPRSAPARAVQGLGTALVTPAALAILSATFAGGPVRTRALGVWGVMGPLGGIAGVLLAGMLISGPGWSWVFWIGVPVSAAALVAARWTLGREKAGAAAGRIDVLGAGTGTLGLVTLVFGLDQAATSGLGSVGAWIGIAGGVAMLILFVGIERRVACPLAPLNIFGRPGLAGANIVTIIQAAVTNTPIFFFVLTMQGVGGWSATETGLAFLPCNAALVAGTAAGTRLTDSRGARWTLVWGMGLLAMSVLWLTRLRSGHDYLEVWLPHLILLGLGLGATAVALNVAGIAGAGPEEHGLAWGLVNTSARIGTAVGLALLVAVAGARTDALAGGAVPTDGETLAGYRAAFLVSGALALLGMAVAGRWIPARETAPRGETPC